MSRQDYNWVLSKPNGLIKVRNDSYKYGIINEEDEIIVPIIYDHVGDFEDGVASIRIGGLYGLINTEGVEIIPPKYQMPFAFYHGLAIIYNDHGLWGFVNMQGEIVIPTVFTRVTPFYDGRATVFMGQVGLYIDVDLNYYDHDTGAPIDCRACHCYNDYLMTKLCCKFWK